MISANYLALEPEKMQTPKKTMVSKSVSPVTILEFSAWDAEIEENLPSPNPLNPLKHPKSPRKYSEIPKNLNLSKISSSPENKKSKIKHISSTNLPEVVSMYEVSKVSEKYKEMFEQPNKNLKKTIKFPVINNKSMLSVYVPDTYTLKNNVKKGKKKISIFEICRIGNRKIVNNRQSGIPNSSILTIYNTINPMNKNFESPAESYGLSSPV